MARLIKQFRYYGYTDENQSANYPNVVTYAALATGNIFANYAPIIQLGIQSDPDVKFYVNNGSTPVAIGATGIYELDLEGLGSISSIRFDRDSLNSIDYANKGNSILIDIMYEGGSA